ncbi:MAG: hydroxymethylbilane synthase, partial [Ahrensia sp.]
KGTVLTPDGSISHDIEMSGPVSDAEGLGQRAGDAIRAKAGSAFFESWA